MSSSCQILATWLTWLSSIHFWSQKSGICYLRGFCGDMTSHENQTMQIRVVFSSSEEVFMYSYLPCTWWSILPLPRMEICYIAVCPSFQIYYIKKEKRKTCLTQLIHRKIAQNITSFYFCLTAVPLLVSKHTKVCTDQFNTFTLNLTFFKSHYPCIMLCLMLERSFGFANNNSCVVTFTFC